ncbi:hypothetical protein AALO_G00004410 [Alosa alosa]|uniref:ZZ-type zinc finger-containing protein 3 n=2 Tax=Alosa alosa TaxID=278164 RepID=A0AAV6HDT7_9TELE|nr:ZZ-type zinc finger-containing protein 3 isoform X1 [Alosa alosa]KAG5285529.1 hypothetical protein AALO_G00004410 [Alosa alosa]
MVKLARFTLQGAHILQLRSKPQDEERTVGALHSMAASRSSRVTRSSVGINGLDENFCRRTLRNRSITQPDEALPAPRARSPKKRQDGDKPQSGHGEGGGGGAAGAGTGPGRKRGLSCSEKEESERTENCERLRPPATRATDGSTESSPALKKPKRCPRSAETGAVGAAAGGGGEEETPSPAAAAAAADRPSLESPRPCSPLTDKDKDESPSGDAPVSVLPPPSLCTEEDQAERGGKETEPVMVALVEEVEEEVRVPSPAPSPPPPQPKEAHKATNGLGEIHREEAPMPDGVPAQALPPTLSSLPTMFPKPAPSTPALLNGSQALGPSSPEPLVPCRSPVSEQTEPPCFSSSITTSSSSSSLSITQLPVVESNGSDEASCSQPQALREPELEVVEVDVVGEEGGEVESCPVQEELAFPVPDELEPGEVVVVEGQVSSTNGGLLSTTTELPEASEDDDEEEDSCGLDGALDISGDMMTVTTAAAMPSNLGSCSVPVCEPPSFTEPHEHRYALRTSPRRAACRPSSPHRDRDDPPASSPVPSPTTPTPTTPHLEMPSSCFRLEAAPTGGPEASCRPGGGLSEPVGAKAFPEVAVAAAAAVFDSRAPRSTKDSAAEEEEEEEEPDVYYFESDHLALKHNKDYQRLLQTISVLEAQRTRAILDLEALARHQREAMSNPITFVEHLQKQVELGLPCPQRVVQLPEIAWDQYTSGVGDFEREFCDKKRKTRQLKLIYEKVGLPIRPKSPLESKKESDSSGLYSSLPSSDAPEQSLSSSRSQMIRGRVCHQNKPDTFNQLWTVEEQKKLEQLLVKFPPEEVEAKRWQKIADALGNRTAKQVASRVQKYFIKLTKAGIPVPGRTPNLCMYSKKASSKRHHHLNKHLYRPSTFLTSYEPPVYMDDEDERSSFNSLQDPTADDSDEEGVPVEYRHLPEYKELLELKRLKKQKLQEIQVESTVVQHMGYKCDVCGMDPIQGVRWHCQDCPPDCAVDFCGNCSDCVYKTETHKPTHRLEPVYQAESFLDRDYCLPHSTGYNYLDPNYFPANR